MVLRSLFKCLNPYSQIFYALHLKDRLIHIMKTLWKQYCNFSFFLSEIREFLVSFPMCITKNKEEQVLNPFPHFTESVCLLLHIESYERVGNRSIFWEVNLKQVSRKKKVTLSSEAFSPPGLPCVNLKGLVIFSQTNRRQQWNLQGLFRIHSFTNICWYF